MLDLLGLQDKDRSESVPFYPWMENCEFIRVTEETLPEVIDRCIEAGLYACDLETTGLNISVYNGETVDKIVGICFATDTKTGYYLPIRHKDDDVNVKWSLVHQEMKRLVESGAKSIWHNGKFDHEFLQFNGIEALGEWDNPKDWEDSMILAYLEDSKQKRISLKHLSETILGRPMLSLKDLCKAKGLDHRDGINYADFDPLWEPTIRYGASDAICTFALYEHFHPKVVTCSVKKDNCHSQRIIYDVEKGTVAATRWMERARVRVDMPKLEDLIRIGQVDWMDSLNELYVEIEKALGRDARPGWLRIFQGELGDRFSFDPNEVDRHHGLDQRIKDANKLAKKRGLDLGRAPITKTVSKLTHPKEIEKVEFPPIYDVAAPKQLGEMLRELGVSGLEATPSGQVATSADVIDRLIERVGSKYSFMSKVSRFRSIQKALTTYLIPLYEDAREEMDQGEKIWTVRVGFSAHRADTGRFTASTSKKETGPIKVTDGGTRVTFHGLPSGYDKSKPECLIRIKEALIPRKGKINVACVAQGTLISTTRGLIPVEEVSPGDSVWTETGHPEPVLKAWQTGVKSVVKVITEKGFQVSLTPDHLVRTVGGDGLAWKSAGDLESGDWIVQATSQRQGDFEGLLRYDTPTYHQNTRKITYPETWTKGLAYFVGLFIGDGSISHRRGVPSCVNLSLGRDSSEVLTRVNQLVRALFGLEFSPRGVKGDVSVWSRPFADWLVWLTEKTSSKKARVPEGILKGSAELKSAFLSGLFDADGSVGKRSGDGVSYFTSSPELSQEVQLLLLSLGIQGNRSEVNRVSNFGLNRGYQISLSGEAVDHFHFAVGFSLSRKQSHLEALVCQGRNRDMSVYYPRQLAVKAVPRQRFPETNRVHTNSRRKDRVSRQALELAQTRPEDCDQKWMQTLLGQGLYFDQVRDVSPVSGEVAVYDITVPSARQFQAGGLIVHNCDYSGVELRIVTALSGEQKWANEYYRCSSCDHQFDRPAQGQRPTWIPPFCPNCGSDKIGDIHTLTAQTIYGEDVVTHKDFKSKRQAAKAVNFALSYGGSGKAVQRAADVSEHEGAQIKGKFDKAYTTLQRWWAHSKAYAHQYGYVRTAFGRNCSMRPWIWLEKTRDNKRMIAQAERNATNAPVQGSSADITKSAMLYIYRECKKRGWLDKVHMLATIHDELVFEIDLDILEEALEMIEDKMTNHKLIQALKWPVPIVVDTELGFDWKCKWNLAEFKLGNEPWPEEIKPYFKRPFIAYDAPPSMGLLSGTRLKLVVGGEQIVLDENGFPIESGVSESSSESAPAPPTESEEPAFDAASDEVGAEAKGRDGEETSKDSFVEMTMEGSAGYYDIPNGPPRKAQIVIKEYAFSTASGLSRALEYGMTTGMQTEVVVKGPGGVDLTEELCGELGVEVIRANFDALFRVIAEYDGIVLLEK